MSIERLKHTKEMLMAQVEGQLGHLNDVDAKELGEVVDMVKDLEEAIYYCTITEAMKKKEEQPITYYREPRYEEEMYRQQYSEPMWRRRQDHEMQYRQYLEDNNGSQKSYYSETNPSSSGNRGNNNGNGQSNGGDRSSMTRRMYMEHKRAHADKAIKMRDLENYMAELCQDMTEMIEDASPEEKKTLEKKMTTLASKVAQLNA